VRVLQLWEVSQQKVGDFINSRLVLATLCTVFTWIFLALPVIATIQAVAWTYLRRHELVDSPLLSEDAQALRRQRAWTEVRDDETEPGAAGAQP
jgi:hypothetical protein